MMNIKHFYNKHRFISTLLVMLMISILIVLIATWLTRYITFHGEEYELPDFVGFDAAQLETFDKEKNIYDFEFVINDSVFMPDKKGGTVLSQDPAAGSKVKQGRKVYFSVIAFSVPKIEMPNLVDLSLRQAENMLQTNNLQVNQVIYKASQYHNAVLEQRYNGRIVEAGTLIPYRSKITLIVGRKALEGETIEGEVSEGEYE